MKGLKGVKCAKGVKGVKGVKGAKGVKEFPLFPVNSRFSLGAGCVVPINRDRTSNGSPWVLIAEIPRCEIGIFDFASLRMTYGYAKLVLKRSFIKE